MSETSGRIAAERLLDTESQVDILHDNLGILRERLADRLSISIHLASEIERSCRMIIEELSPQIRVAQELLRCSHAVPKIGGAE